eukprot:8715013-Pyramimonas_sp.AAC.1
MPTVGWGVSRHPRWGARVSVKTRMREGISYTLTCSPQSIGLSMPFPVRLMIGHGNRITEIDT